MPTGYLGSEGGASAMASRSKLGESAAAGAGGLGTGALLKEHADASKEQVRPSTGQL